MRICLHNSQKASLFVCVDILRMSTCGLNASSRHYTLIWREKSGLGFGPKPLFYYDIDPNDKENLLKKSAKSTLWVKKEFLFSL